MYESNETTKWYLAVTSIGEYAFCYCPGLTSINASVWKGVDKQKCVLYVPTGSWSMYCSAPVWMDFVNIEEFGNDSPNVKKYDVNGDGVVDVADITALAKYILTNAKEEGIFVEDGE